MQIISIHDMLIPKMLCPENNDPKSDYFGRWWHYQCQLLVPLGAAQGLVMISIRDAILLNSLGFFF
jgi:hypothetical protein